MRDRYPFVLIISLLASPLLLAEQTNDAPPPPSMPDSGGYTEAQQELEPQVTITRRGNEVVEEYRQNGRLFMIKITPSKGFPYYLIDSDGDGSLETRRNSLDDPEVVRWRIFSW